MYVDYTQAEQKLKLEKAQEKNYESTTTSGNSYSIQSEVIIQLLVII